MATYKKAQLIIQSELEKKERARNEELIESLNLVHRPAESIRIAAWVFANSDGRMDFDQYDRLLDALLTSEDAGLSTEKLWELTNEALHIFKKKGILFDSCVNTICENAMLLKEKTDET